MNKLDLFAKWAEFVGAKLRQHLPFWNATEDNLARFNPVRSPLTTQPLELLSRLTYRQQEILKSMGFALDGDRLKSECGTIRLFTAGEYHHFVFDDGKLCVPFVSADPLISHLRGEQTVVREAVVRPPHTVEQVVAAIAEVEGADAVTVLSNTAVAYRVRRKTENVINGMLREVYRPGESPCLASA